jgi:transcription elongation GreA/GreB family factor
VLWKVKLNESVHWRCFREALGGAARELRYWTARLASAEVAEPDPEADHVVFGMAVTVLREDETEATFRIVGEDEAKSVHRQDRLDRARCAGALGQPAGRRSATPDRRGRGPVHQ